MTIEPVALRSIGAQPENVADMRSVPLRVLLTALFCLFALDNILLLGFLGHNRLIIAALAVLLPSAFGYLTMRAVPREFDVSLRALSAAIAAAALLLILGGEGRFFFATNDWQIRDAVLADMGAHAWPFDYLLQGQSQMLRAPIGMYLLPALLGGASQSARDVILLVQNSFILGLLFAIGGTLFADRRARIIALIIFVAFSGLDVIGNGIMSFVIGPVDWDHIERWPMDYQYSSTITQIFWVPQHAFAGWACALAYLLWRRGMAPVGLFAAVIPLVALWSPLAILGALPFCIVAGLTVLFKKTWNRWDVFLAVLATAIATPALLYLQTGAGAVASGFRPPPLPVYTLLIVLEVAPFVVPLLLERATARDGLSLLIVAACLILMPFWSIGAFTDFQMRASIMPLAILAVAFAGWVLRLERRGGKLFAVAILALGSVTASAEAYRALRYDPSPEPRCSLVGVWTQQDGMKVPYSSYFSVSSAFSHFLAPREPADRVANDGNRRCWAREWRTIGGRHS